MQSKKKIKEIPHNTETELKLLRIRPPDYSHYVEDLIMSVDMREKLLRVYDELRNSDILGSYGLEPKKKVLLYGPSGTGKTFSVKTLSSISQLPIVRVNVNTLRASNIAHFILHMERVFEFIGDSVNLILFEGVEYLKTSEELNLFLCMLGRCRGRSLIFVTVQDKRVINNNFWRVFDEVIEYELPNQEDRVKLFDRYLRCLRRHKDISLELLAKNSEGLSPRDISKVAVEALKTSILKSDGEVSLIDLLESVHQQKEINKLKGMIGGEDGRE